VGPSTGLFDVGGQRLVTLPIRGRAGELKVIGALVTALAQGRRGVLVIEGPPGIRKSRLLTEVLAFADKCGVRTLFGEAFEYQQTAPFFSLFMAMLAAPPTSARPHHPPGPNASPPSARRCLRALRSRPPLQARYERKSCLSQ